jgi:uncharacterized membrane protein
MSHASRGSNAARDRRADWIVVFLALLFAVALSTLVWLRYAALQTSTDLAIYSQVVWNTAHGQPFRCSLLPLTENYLGNHFSPFLALFVPLYLVWPDPRVLLLAQVIISALAVWPLFWFSRERLPTPWAGVLLSAAFLLCPALHHQSLDDFHGIAVGTAVVMWAFFALLSRRDLLLFCILPLMVLVREDLPLLIIMMGLYAFFVQRRRSLGAVLFLGGITLSALVLLVLIPAFRGGQEFVYTDYYDYLGDSPLALMRTLVLRPRVWLSRVFYPPKILLAVQLLLPVAFLPILAPSVILLGGSALAYLLLVDFPFRQIYVLDGQNQAVLIPVVYFGTVLGLERLVRWLGPRWNARRVALASSVLVLLLSILSLAVWGPLSDPAKRAEFRVDEQSRAERDLLSLIPPDAGVVADDRFAATLSTREGFFIFGGLFDYPYPLEYLLYEDTPVGYPAHPPALLGPPTEEGWLVPQYQPVGSAGLTELQQRTGTVEAAQTPAPVVFGEALALRGSSSYGGVLSAIPGQPLEVALVWETLQDHLPRLVPFVHLIERRPEGEYRWASVDSEVYGGLFPTDWWQSGVAAKAEVSEQTRSSTASLTRERPDLVGDVWTLELPPWLPPGQYELQVGLYTREGMERLQTSNGGTTHAVAAVDVAPPLAPPEAPPEVPIAMDLPLAEGLTLYGRNPTPESMTAGQNLDVTLFWQATGEISSDYNLRFDLLSGDGAEPARSWTRSPLQGRYGTSLWPSGAVLADWHPLALPAGLPPGTFRLKVTVLDGPLPAGQSMELATVRVCPAD